MLNKFIRKISFLLLLTLVVQIINPLISLAANPSEKFNGEDILFKYDGYIYTSPEENDTITVKAYKDDGTLIEEISVDKNQKNKAVRLDYTVTIDIPIC